MAALTIRNLTDSTKQGLRLRAAQRGASMEDEVRSILRLVVEAGLSLDDLAAKREAGSHASAWHAIQTLRDKYGTFDLELPERTDLAGSRGVFADD
ncbi:FitA-like ribbon-helix-helix domain-containing protein [Kumtagia ephedrae]|uniref:Plasmid stabilization protein n=1 Tax=Kumtagia ephedrae TaxID=2116701 RepID=A0A2P7RZP9_9HYPH|nr:plasmid stabilization protein [Mesorhizobium ephedrae]PSJ55691.1 plasmid stabilization protein [Mesorhizobium ephedrae]